MVLHNGPLIRSNFPRPGSRAGDQKRQEFLAAMGVKLDDTRALWTPNGTDTTTSTESSRHAGVTTWDATVASRYSQVGSGWAQSFTIASSHEGDIPDDDRYSFGDGVVDGAFSVLALFKPTVVNASQTLLAKANSATAEEWELWIHSSSVAFLTLTDESASATIAVETAGLTAATTVLVCATYDGSGAATGLNIYKNGVLNGNGRSVAGTYVAMENTAASVHIGARYTTKAKFFGGDIMLWAICAKELSAEDNWDIVRVINGFFGLSLA